MSDPRACWAPAPQRPVVNLALVREFRYEYAAVSPWDGCLDYMTAEKMNTENMSIFLAQVSEAHRDEFIIMVLDGASSHKGKELKLPKNVSLVPLPPYSPELNPAEQIWNTLRRDYFAVGSRTGAVPLRPVSSPRHVKRSVRISRTTLSCRLHPKGYGTYQAGSTFTTGSTVPRNPNTNQGLGISNPYSTCSSRSLCVFALASDAAVSSSQPSPSRRQNTDWNAQPENS